jgi:acetate kinase
VAVAVGRVLVVNAGSSSLKLAVLSSDDAVLGRASLGPVDTLGDGELEAAVAGLGRFDAVGHRIVHGGPDLTSPVLVDASARSRLAALCDLAPLHQPASLAALDAVCRLAPDVPAVACFDTAFHATLPAAAATYAVPAEWRDRLGVRRYGFHGLSHAHASRRASEMVDGGADPEFRAVTCHLGAGASLAAVRGGRSVDTTMGFTPLEGLVMATRSGSVDPGMVTWLLDRAGLSAGEVADALEHRSGLTALAGTGDVSRLVDDAAGGSAPAALALDVYVHRLRAGIAAMAAALGGLDALVFTGGVGENVPFVRSEAVAGLAFLGVAVDDALDEPELELDADVSSPGSPARTLVVAAREDLEIARGVRAVLGGSLAGRAGA